MKSLLFKSSGELIRIARKNAGLSVAELAKKIGMSASGLRNYELGNRIPDSKTLIKLANSLQVNIFSLIERPYLGVAGFVNIFQMAEKIYGLHPVEKDGQIMLAMEDPSFKEGDEQNFVMQTLLRDWMIMYNKHKSGKITDDEYLLYREKYPYHFNQLPQETLNELEGRKLIDPLLVEIQNEAFIHSNTPNADPTLNIFQPEHMLPTEISKATDGITLKINPFKKD